MLNCILLVEDDHITTFLNQRIIKGLRITEKISTARNGKEAFAFVKNFALLNENSAPELILVDLKMPVIDGFEFIQAFKELQLTNSKSIKIIILTTSQFEEDIQNIINDNNIGFINKPLTEDKLLSVLWKDYKFKDKKHLSKN